MGVRNIALVVIALGLTACSGGQLATSVARSVSTDAWVVPPPLEDMRFFGAGSEISESSWSEVPPTKLDVALEQLGDSSWVELDEQEVSYFAGQHYKPPFGQRVYLVRAVYMFGGTGRYILKLHGKDLLVSHSSLGRGPNEYHRAALVVALPDVPARVYVRAEAAA